MAIQFVQKATGLSATGVTTLQSNALPSPPQVGNCIVAWAWGLGNGAGGSGHTVKSGFFTDNYGNQGPAGGGIYFEPAIVAAKPSDVWCSAAIVRVTSSGASFKVTTTPQNELQGSVSGNLHIGLAEFSGMSGTCTNFATNFDVTGTPQSLAALNPRLPSLVLAVMSNDSPTTPTTPTTPAGFTSLEKETSGASFQVGEAAYAIGMFPFVDPVWNTGTVNWAFYELELFDYLIFASGGQNPNAIAGRPIGF